MSAPKSLSASLIDAMTRHAREAYPREACGLVVVIKGRRRYVPCTNASGEPGDRFTISAEEFAAAEARGEVTAIFHSHPDASAVPSAHDLSSCRASGLTWFILSVPGMQWCEITPDTSEPPSLYGREFVHGATDCYSFVRDWYALERGIFLPDFVREDDWWAKGQNLYLDNFEKAGFGRVSLAEMQAGDVLLMQVHANVPNHAAILLEGNQIGHHLYGRLSSREVYGGYYKKHTTHILRYGA